jgi:hypothetical protein
MTFRVTLALILTAVACHAEGFVSSLSPQQRAELGLDRLSPAQLEALDRQIESYRRNAESSAATAAVEAYREKEVPTIVSRAVQEQKQKEEAARVERVESRIKGKFRGWFGGTVFELENGQIWKQVGSDTYATRVVDSPEVEIAKSQYGHFRLRLSDGAWVNVKRLK